MGIGKNNRETTPPHQRENGKCNRKQQREKTATPHQREREQEREGATEIDVHFTLIGKNRHQNHKALDRNMKILGNTISNVVHEMNPTAPLLLVSSLA